MVEFTACLRPAFTEKVFKQLHKGESLNVLTDDPAEVARLFEDLQLVASGVHWVRVSFRAYDRSFAGFLAAVWQQLPVGLRGEAVPERWAEVVAMLEQVGVPVWLWFEQLQCLFDSDQIDPLYDQRFIDSLNSLRNDGRFALVGVTPKKLQDYAWFVERIPRNASVLELQPVEVPKLSAIGVEQILAQHPSVVREEQSVIREYVVKLEQQQYGFLLFVLGKVEADVWAGQPIKKKLKRWKKAFFKKEFASLSRSGKARHWVLMRIKELWRWINVFKLLSPIFNFIKLFKNKKGM